MGQRRGTGTTRRRVSRTGTIVLTLVLGVLSVVGCDGNAPVGATSVAHPTLVSTMPTTTTPHATDGDVRMVAVVGDVVVMGGSFTGAQQPDRTPVDRRYLLAFDRATGQILPDFAPQIDNEVFTVVAAADGRSVYIGGRFNSVDGVAQHKVARLSIEDGRPLPFASGVDAVVTAMALQGDRLYIGGVFHTVQGQQRRLAALDADTGRLVEEVDPEVSGTHRGGAGKIWRIEPSPDGEHLLVVGSFSHVGGQPRNQVVQLDTAGDGNVRVSSWSTTAFSGYCASFSDYVRDVSYSPDGAYFVVVTTGAKGSGLNGTCDSVTRWEDDGTGDAVPTWIEYSGGDSYYSVEVTGAAIYVGGHFRYSNNSYGTDSLGPGGSATEGIAALDPTNGLPLSWNPGRNRGRAVWHLQATSDGLYVASDTDRIARYLYRGRIAFFPLAGGRPVPQPARTELPAQLDQLDPGGWWDPARITSRAYDGESMGAPESLGVDADRLSDVRAAFWVDGTLYTARSNETLVAWPYDGETLGEPTTVDLQRMTSFADDLGDMRGAFYDAGRLYYSVDDSSTLYMRYFSTENRVVGAQRFEIAGSSGSVRYRDMESMVRLGDHVYFTDRGSGTLRRGTWRATGGIDPGSVSVVSNANADGLSWTGTELWARPGIPVNQPPTVTGQVACTGLACTFTADAADADGEIVDLRWDAGDGSTSEGVEVQHTYAGPGTYTVRVTAVDDAGASTVHEIPVEVDDADPEATFTETCTGGVCTFDGSGSTDPDGDVVSHDWDFGDGGDGSGAQVAHTFEETGTYDVTLTVTDDRGRTASSTRAVSVEVTSDAPAQVGVAATTTGGSSRNHSVDVPAETAPGDQMLLFVSTNGNPSNTIGTPAGWERVLDAPTSRSNNAVFARTAEADDASSTVTVPLGGFARADLVLSVHRGLEVAGITSQGGYVTPEATGEAGDWALWYWADKSATTAEWPEPAGTVVVHAHAGTGAGHVSEMLATSGGPMAAGTVAPRDASVAVPVANAAAVTVLLRPT